MSTFKGIVAEFPQIRIDYFRPIPEHKAPLACFLSHVHSDHLAGLESLRAPFVYCSAATKQILLRLEKYHYRINFSKGVLESRNVTYDRSMRKLAKPLPLETPTRIELAPGYDIQVTLLDANHCVGAVMFLIEGDGKAILYTGDIRAESWWVNSLVQNPILLPYALGYRRLDCIYLDTTFATQKEPYRNFPSKAEGLRELLGQVSEFPKDTVFYFHSWTFGYENVWIALSSFLGSPIHVDDYRARIYGSLSTLEKRHLREAGLKVPTDNNTLRDSGLEIREAPSLCGFRNGNHIQPGCLTSRESVRIHSCENGTGCRMMDRDTDNSVVHIIPIVTRVNGVEIAELGAGGGKGDLEQKEELETEGAVDIQRLLKHYGASTHNGELLAKALALLRKTLGEGEARIKFDMQLQMHDLKSQDNTVLKTLVSTLSSHASPTEKEHKELRSRTIRFPYARHSSYQELCDLVENFKPKDVFPCTVDHNHWMPELSMRNLFGHLCSGNTFRHDLEMLTLHEAKADHKILAKRDTQEMYREPHATAKTFGNPSRSKRTRLDNMETSHDVINPVDSLDSGSCGSLGTPLENVVVETTKSRTSRVLNASSSTLVAIDSKPAEQQILPSATTTLTRAGSTTSTLATKVMDTKPEVLKFVLPSTVHDMPHTPRHSYKARHRKLDFTNCEIAYRAAIGADLTWSDFGGLVSTRRKADREEEEL